MFRRDVCAMVLPRRQAVGYTVIRDPSERPFDVLQIRDVILNNPILTKKT